MVSGNNLRERVIALVEDAHMSQKDFADMIHAPQSTVNGWFTQENRQPSNEYIVPIAELFSVSCSWLLSGKEYYPVPPDVIAAHRSKSDGDDSSWTPQEQEIINIYRKLSLKQQMDMIQYLFSLKNVADQG